MKTVPARLFSQRARTPVMFGSLGSNCVGWYGNEPEAKTAGGASLQSNLFGFGSVHEDIEYLGGVSPGSAVKGILVVGALYYLLK